MFFLIRDCLIMPNAVRDRRQAAKDLFDSWNCNHLIYVITDFYCLGMMYILLGKKKNHWTLKKGSIWQSLI